jgi:hypothetical protein
MMLKALHLGLITIFFCTLLAASAENKESKTTRSAAVQISKLRPAIFIKSKKAVKNAELMKITNI